MYRPFVEYATALGSSRPIEGSSIEDNVVLSSAVSESLVEAKEILPFASEVYDISPNIKDYILVPVTIMPSDLPNRNGVAFSLKELTTFNPDSGCLGYKTWKGKGLFEEHQNNDVTKSRGIILDVSLKPITNAHGDLYSVVTLTAWDRSKDPMLANAILTGASTCYSMGSYASDFSCSICGALHSKGGCDHVKKGKPSFNTYEIMGQRKLAYLNMVGMMGFEVSAVKDPAFVQAESPVSSVYNWDR